MEMTNRYRESASLKVRVGRGGVGDSASGGSVTEKQKPSGPGLPFFPCLGHSPRHNKAFVPTPGTARRVSCGFGGGAAQLNRYAAINKRSSVSPCPRYRFSKAVIENRLRASSVSGSVEPGIPPPGGSVVKEQKKVRFLVL